MPIVYLLKILANGVWVYIHTTKSIEHHSAIARTVEHYAMFAHDCTTVETDINCILWAIDAGL